MIMKNEFNQVSDRSWLSLTTSKDLPTPPPYENGYNNLHWKGVKFVGQNNFPFGCVKNPILFRWENTFTNYHSPAENNTTISNQNGIVPGKQTANQQMNPSLDAFDPINPYCLKLFSFLHSNFLSNQKQQSSCWQANRKTSSLANNRRNMYKILAENSKVPAFLDRFAAFFFLTIFSPANFPLGVR